MQNIKPKIELLSAEQIIELQVYHKIPELNNVIEGFKSKFFGILMLEEMSLQEYSLLYVNGTDNLMGVILHTGRDIKDRDLNTIKYCNLIEKTFSNENQLTIFNTFQNKLMQCYENFGIICVPDYIYNLKPTLLLTQRKQGVDCLLWLDIFEYYQELFIRNKYISNQSSQSKVYLMYDRRLDMIKIGNTKNQLEIRRKGIAEPTKKAQDPLIEILVAWTAPKDMENHLHLKFDKKRVRGE